MKFVISKVFRTPFTGLPGLLKISCTISDELSDIVFRIHFGHTGEVLWGDAYNTVSFIIKIESISNYVSKWWRKEMSKINFETLLRSVVFALINKDFAGLIGEIAYYENIVSQFISQEIESLDIVEKRKRKLIRKLIFEDKFYIYFGYQTFQEWFISSKYYKELIEAIKSAASYNELILLIKKTHKNRVNIINEFVSEAFGKAIQEIEI